MYNTEYWIYCTEYWAELTLPATTCLLHLVAFQALWITLLWPGRCFRLTHAHHPSTMYSPCSWILSRMLIWKSLQGVMLAKMRMMRIQWGLRLWWTKHGPQMGTYRSSVLPRRRYCLWHRQDFYDDHRGTRARFRTKDLQRRSYVVANINIVIVIVFVLAILGQIKYVGINC